MNIPPAAVSEVSFPTGRGGQKAGPTPKRPISFKFADSVGTDLKGKNTDNYRVIRLLSAKAGAAADLVPECDLDATEYETWPTDTSATGDVTIQYDTTVSYTSANELVCGFDDVTSYELATSRSENAMLVTHFKTRTELPADFFTGEFRMSGSGTVEYKDGYLITITSMNLVIDVGQLIMKTYVMNLALEKGYTAVLHEAPGADMMRGPEPGPNEVAVSGPISKDGVVVGYFEVMGDNRVIIRDADMAVIESHG